VVHFSNRRLKRADARRVEIMRAAARVFRARGFAAAGMRDIAVAADLSSGNLYHYFRGKDELLFFCQDRSLDRLLGALRTAAAARGPLRERLHALAVRHVLCLIADVEGSAAHFEVEALAARQRRAIVAKRDRYERGVRNLVAAGLRRRVLTARDATVATRTFLGALNWTAQWFRPYGPQSAKKSRESSPILPSPACVRRTHDGEQAPRRPAAAGPRADNLTKLPHATNNETTHAG